MNHRTRDTMIGISLVLNILLAAALLYDYTVSDSRYTIWILAGYFVYTLVFLFMWGISRREESAVDALTTYVLDNGQILAPRPAKSVEAPKAAVVVAETPATGPFLYQGFTLHARDVDLKNGGRRTIYFFAKHKPKSGHPVPKPAGFHVGMNERTGLPFLKKGTGADGEDLTPTLVEAYRPQCSALTDEGHQCRNSARQTSKYCSSHFGYQPPTMAKAAAKREDTSPRVKDAPDTLPAVRRSTV